MCDEFNLNFAEQSYSVCSLGGVKVSNIVPIKISEKIAL